MHHFLLDFITVADPCVSYWRVHHGIVIGHPEMELKQWLVLDPWRHSGRLFWSMVGEDEVPWVWWEESKKSS